MQVEVVELEVGAVGVVHDECDSVSLLLVLHVLEPGRRWSEVSFNAGKVHLLGRTSQGRSSLFMCSSQPGACNRPDLCLWILGFLDKTILLI